MPLAKGEHQKNVRLIQAFFYNIHHRAENMFLLFAQHYRSLFWSSLETKEMNFIYTWFKTLF